tara:strand:- start:8286 stop:8441 length:156 start_codon:yes stop_codon:yes gene_type:complete
MYNCNYFLLLKAKKLRELNPAVYGIYSLAYLVFLVSNPPEQFKEDIEKCGW